MSTKADLLKRIAELPDDAVIAIPVLWSKDAAEDAYQYANDVEVTLTDEQWARVASEYENAEYYGDEDMIQIIDEVLEEA